MITELQIKNFKGIDEISLRDLSRFNIIIGKNDSGKSSILESIFAFKAALVSPPIHFKTILRNNTREQNARELWYNYQTSSDPTIRVMIEDKECTISFHSDFTSQSVDVNLTIEGQSGLLKLNSFLNSITNHTQIQKNTLHQPVGDTLFGMEFFDTTTGRNTTLWELSQDNLPLTKDTYDSSINHLKLADYMNGQRRLALNKNNVDFFIDGFGEGHRSGLGLFSLAKRIKNSILLIEEIETHQHPTALAQIIKELIDICTERNNQVILTTHSPEVLQEFSNYANTKLFHLRKDSNSLSVNPIAHNDITMLRDVGWNIGNILRYQKIVMVEGHHDEVIFRNIFYKINNVWPEEIGITFISAGDNGDKQSDLLRAISYAERTVFVQRDKDDKTPDQINQSISDAFVKKLQGEGYQLESKLNDSILVLKHKSGTIKKLSRDNIIITGMPEKLSNLKRHATDDYLLSILESDAALRALICKGKFTPNSQSEKSKTLLEQALITYDTSKIEELIKKCTKEAIPKELLDIIKKISS